MITRRFLLKAFSLLGLLPFARLLLAAESEKSSLTFYVAGVRYQEQFPAALNEGAHVTITLERHKQEPCYAVYTGDKIRLGYVPRYLTNRLFPESRLIGTVQESNRHALPWKRHRIRIRTA